MRTERERPGILFVLWEEVYRLLHRRQYRQHMAYQRAFDAWQGGTGPMPDFKEYHS